MTGDVTVTFGTSVSLNADEPIDVVVTARVHPGDPGGLHCPPSGPEPEVVSVVLDVGQMNYFGDLGPGDEIVDLVDEDMMIELEDQAILHYTESLDGPEDQPEDDDARRDDGRAEFSLEPGDVGPDRYSR